MVWNESFATKDSKDAGAFLFEEPKNTKLGFWALGFCQGMMLRVSWDSYLFQIIFFLGIGLNKQHVGRWCNYQHFFWRKRHSSLWSKLFCVAFLGAQGVVWLFTTTSRISGKATEVRIFPWFFGNVARFMFVGSFLRPFKKKHRQRRVPCFSNGELRADAWFMAWSLLFPLY